MMKDALSRAKDGAKSCKASIGRGQVYGLITNRRPGTVREVTLENMAAGRSNGWRRLS
jgi:hypothetical protein